MGPAPAINRLKAVAITLMAFVALQLLGFATAEASIGGRQFIRMQHPIFDLVHLSFILLTGMYTYTISRHPRHPLYFIAATAVGTLFYLSFGISHQRVDVVVASSLVLLLLVYWTRLQWVRYSPVLLIIAGLFQGVSYGPYAANGSGLAVFGLLLAVGGVQLALVYGYGPLCAYLARTHARAYAQLESLLTAIIVLVALAFFTRGF